MGTIAITQLNVTTYSSLLSACLRNYPQPTKLVAQDSEWRLQHAIPRLSLSVHVYKLLVLSPAAISAIRLFFHCFLIVTVIYVHMC